VELGSSPPQWNDKRAAMVVARSAMAALNGETTCKVALGVGGAHYNMKFTLGIGGAHYNMKFTKLALETDIAFGHMIPKYAVPLLNKEVLRQCIERTWEKVELVLLDWKGIKGSYKSSVANLVEELGLAWEKV